MGQAKKQVYNFMNTLIYIEDVQSRLFAWVNIYRIIIYSAKMQSMKIPTKIPNGAIPKKVIKSLSSIKQSLHMRMIKQYSTSQGYFYTKTIDDLIESNHLSIFVEKEGDKNCINTNDVKFDDSKEHMEKYYREGQSGQEFPELLQYYKYYSQDSICFLNREFAFLTVHHDKKKAVLYQQLKKQLNISDSEQSLEEVTGLKSQKVFDNVLTGLDFSRNNDQSYLVAEVLKKLVHHYGPSRVKTINKIDSQFKFMTHNLVMGKSKNNTKQGPSLINPQTMLESTNTSVRNNCQIKKGKEVSKNSHRRFGSCQVPKTLNLKSLNPNSNMCSAGKDKKSRLRRRKSAELLSSVDLNSATLQQIYKKSSVKTEEQGKASKVLLTEVNFRDKMEELRQKIRREKQNLSRKPQSACVTKKKSKK